MNDAFWTGFRKKAAAKDPIEQWEEQEKLVRESLAKTNKGRDERGIRVDPRTLQEWRSDSDGY